MVKLVKNMLFWTSTVLLVVAILLIAIPKLFGIEFRAVITGSMTPEIPVGSLVVIVPTKAEDIKVGDDITFISVGEKIVTHRVIEINHEKNEFITWGIANDKSAIDAPNKYENILGVAKLHIPLAGRIFSWFSTAYGKIIAMTGIVAVYILSCILGIWSKDKKKNPAVSVQGEQNTSSSEQIRELFSQPGVSQTPPVAKQEGQHSNFESDLPETAVDDDGSYPALEHISDSDSLIAFLKSDETLRDSIEGDDLLKNLLEGR